MPKGATQTVVQRPSEIKIEQTREVGSSPTNVNYRQVSDNKNIADVISAAMSQKFVDEVYNDPDRRWRWTSTDGVQKLLELGKPDENGYLYYHVVRSGENKGIYCVTRERWRSLPAKDSMRLHEPSIRDAIKEDRPLAFGDGYDGGDWLDVGGGYDDDDVSRVAQFEAAREAGAPQAVNYATNAKFRELIRRHAANLRQSAKDLRRKADECEAQASTLETSLTERK